MHPVKQWIVGTGVVIAALGYQCIPTGKSLMPDHFLSSFAQLSDTGTVMPVGLLMMIAGICLIVVGFLIPQK